MRVKMKTEEKQALIPSFAIDHRKLLPGIYESRVDFIGQETVTTFDIRMKKPNREPVVHPNAMHTIEHLAATFLRNQSDMADRIVYWGPMGCLTGCYLIVKGRPAPEEILPLMIRTFDYIVHFQGTVPGTLPENCGNYLLHDLEGARYEAKKYLQILKKNPGLRYPD